MEKTFGELGLREALVLGLKKQNITVPTEIQKEVIPSFLQGKDIIGRSETGSGKTLAYLLPIFEKVDTSLRSTQAIILTPTHELAAQVQKQAEILAEQSGLAIKSILIIGGASMTRQMDKLKEKPQIVVGSAGRILDLIQKRKIAAHTVKTIVIDEADRMLDDMNLEHSKAVIKTTLKERQLVLLSASISEETKMRAKELMKEEVLDMSAEATSLLPATISHFFICAEQREKFLVLRKILAGEKPKKAIVFLNNPENIEVTVDKLNYHGLKASGIYGGIYKTERRNALEDFREDRVHILVSSDISARGLDIPDVTHIINLDIPEEPVYYLHRAGRTGRKGQPGIAISIVTAYEEKWIHKYERTWKLSFAQMEMTFGKLAESESVQKEIEEKPKKKEAPQKKDAPKVWETRKKEKVSVSKKKAVSHKKVEEPVEQKEKLGFFAQKALKLAEKEAKKQKITKN